jgi:2-keto-4-pentenoate hydratase/2-oxohepta-3-ene-1,7-dioic acid hydratase in catechol pathway
MPRLIFPGGSDMGQTRRTFLKLAGAAGLGAAAAPGALGAAQPKSRTVASRTNGNGAKELPRNMTFCTLRRDSRFVLGIRTPRGVLDVEKAAKALRRSAPTTIDEVLQGTDPQALKALVDAAVANGAAKSAFVPEDQAPFGPCVTNPEKIMMLGYNYKKHVAEVKKPVPDSPVLFNKYNNALNWHGGVINLPQKVAKKFDYEVELVVVMGKAARDVPKEKALDYVFGYCVGNDFSARDLQFKTTQLMLGKTSDGFGPIGPWLVTADQIPDVQKLGLQTRVNGELRQNSNTDDMIFDVKTIVSYASQIWTLKPGDLFFTGTPEGVILGKPEDQQVWLKAGDVVVTSIEKLGDLRITLAPAQQA